ncbi:hypothetical protein UMZ34_12980 [Halopseudomonas pachastrellae]|nr:hypothetical protein UMZ34_12980 [Halopseudomonas pachastrellae]
MRMTSEPPVMTGPLLFLDHVEKYVLRLSVLFIADNGECPEPIETVHGVHTAEILAEYDHMTVWRARFDLPANRSSCYAWNGQSYSLASDFRGDIRIAYVSCNGEQIGDLEREGSERNAMWARLTEDHRNAPFSLLLHGGDQVYADQVTEGHPLSEDWPEHIPKDPSRADLADLRHYFARTLPGALRGALSCAGICLDRRARAVSHAVGRPRYLRWLGIATGVEDRHTGRPNPV